MGTPKRVAAAHDLSGLGRCSLTVVLPVLAAMGVQAYPMLTAYLSAHTGFPPTPRAVFRDLTAELRDTVAHWRALGAEFDAIYSGFLGGYGQIDILQDFVDTFATPRTLVLIDPVMGDGGAVYRTYTPELCSAMTKLCRRATVVTPNLTEAAILLGEDYDPAPGDAKVRDWLCRLSQDGARCVVLTGIQGPDGTVGAACRDRSGAVSVALRPAVPGRFSGTGDLFASVLLGYLLRGEPLAAATDGAVAFVAHCAAHTIAAEVDPVEGVCFEGLLGRLTRPLPQADSLCGEGAEVDRHPEGETGNR